MRKKSKIALAVLVGCFLGGESWGMMSPDSMSEDTGAVSFCTSAFTDAEDTILRELVESRQETVWSEIARDYNGRISDERRQPARRLRERWSLLNPVPLHTWTAEADAELQRLYTVLSPVWSAMQTRFGGVSANTLKNRFRQLAAKASEEAASLEEEAVEEAAPVRRHYAARRDFTPKQTEVIRNRLGEYRAALGDPDARRRIVVELARAFDLDTPEGRTRVRLSLNNRKSKVEGDIEEDC